MDTGGYEPNDPKSKGYHDRMSEAHDNRDKTQPTKEQLLDMVYAHMEGQHDEVPREFCPVCEHRA